MAPPSYQYEPIAEDEIRLFRLLPVEPSPQEYSVLHGYSSKLTGELHTYRLSINHNEDQTNPNPVGNKNALHYDSLLEIQTPHLLVQFRDEAPEYDAISYVWGEDESNQKDGRKSVLTIVKTNGEESELEITVNLEDALRRFRSRIKKNESGLYLWIDAVCINQLDIPEKSAQIRKMADIYSQAEKVRVWLGDEDTDSQVAFRFIQRLLSLEDFDEIANDPVSDGEWNAFRNLMQKPWFKRRWIVQEIAFAKRATVYCGRNAVSWNELASAVSLFATKGDELRQMFQKSATYKHNPDYLGEIDAYGAKSLVDIIERMFRKSEGGDVMEHLLSLETLITCLTAFDAKLPHDCVYAIMRLSSDARPGSRQSISCLSPVQLHSPSKPSGYRGNGSAATESIPGSVQTFSTRMTDSPDNIIQVAESVRSVSSEDMLSVRAEAQTRGRTSARLGVPNEKLARSRSRSPGAARREAEKAFSKPKKHVLVDYDKSMLELCREVIKFAAEQSKSIDMICKPWVPSSTRIQHGHSGKIHKDDAKKLPSWIQPLGKRPYSLNPKEEKVYERVNANPLVGTFLSGQKTYSACGFRPIPEKFLPPEKTLISGRILHASGFVLDTIEETSDAASNAVIPAEWLEFGGWTKRSEPPPDRFWRTLVANRASSDGPKNPPPYWRYACTWSYARISDEANFNPERQLLNIHGPASAPVRSFLHRVQSVVWNRRLIRTHGWDDGEEHSDLLGLAPYQAKKGDKVCILYGCSVPVLLRLKNKRSQPKLSPSPSDKLRRRSGTHKRKPIASGSKLPAPTSSMPTFTVSTVESGDAASSLAVSEDGSSVNESGWQGTPSSTPATPVPEYTLIGECYIHGMMDGEAFLQQDEFKLQEEDFNIGCVVDCDCDSCETGTPRVVT